MTLRILAVGRLGGSVISARNGDMEMNDPIYGSGAIIKSGDNNVSLGAAYGPRTQPGAPVGSGKPTPVEKKNAQNTSYQALGSDFAKRMQQAAMAALRQGCQDAFGQTVYSRDDVLQNIRERLRLWASIS